MTVAANPPNPSRREHTTGFSQGNKLCCRATPAQAAWLAQHTSGTGVQISAVMRAAIDLYIQTNNQPSQ